MKLKQALLFAINMALVNSQMFAGSTSVLSPSTEIGSCSNPMPHVPPGLASFFICMVDYEFQRRFHNHGHHDIVPTCAIPQHTPISRPSPISGMSTSPGPNSVSGISSSLPTPADEAPPTSNSISASVASLSPIQITASGLLTVPIQTTNTVALPASSQIPANEVSPASNQTPEIAGILPNSIITPISVISSALDPAPHSQTSPALNQVSASGK